MSLPIKKIKHNEKYKIKIFVFIYGTTIITKIT